MKSNSVLQSDKAVTKTYVLSKRLTVTMTAGAQGFVCEWEPGVPTKPLSAKEQRRYLQARHELFQELSTLLGVGVAVLDLD